MQLCNLPVRNYIKAFTVICFSGFFLTLTSCGAEEGSSLKLVGGNPDLENRYPSVVLIRILKKSGETRHCSAVFVSYTTLLTAAHCVDNAESVFLGDEEALQIEIDPSYSPSNMGADFAIVVFKEQVREFSLVASSLPELDEAVTLVGFGRESYYGSSLGERKRKWGTNTIDNILLEPGCETCSILSVEGDDQGRGKDQDVQIAPGDSGGPLFNEFDEVIGIASHYLDGEKGDRVTGYFVETGSVLARQLMRKAASNIEGVEITFSGPPDEGIILADSGFKRRIF